MPDSGPVAIIPIAFDDTKLFKQFLHVPFTINKDDPYWVPPVLAERKRFMNPKRGPFFDNGEVQYFLAMQDGRAVGRITAQLNHLHEERYQDNTGFFGFFESINDKAVAHGLLDAAAEWLGDRGKTRVLGPLGFSIYEEVGILVDGYDEIPALMQTHNPPYYEELVTSWGLEKSIDWYAFRFVNPYFRKTYVRDEARAKREALLGSLMKRVDRMGLTLRNPKFSEINEKAEKVLGIFNDNWKDNWGHVDLTRKQWNYLVSEVKDLMRMDMIYLIEDETGDLVAFALGVPDINPVLKHSKGRLWPATLARLLWYVKRSPTRVRTIIMGVKREWQGRRLHHAMLLRSNLDHEHKTSLEQCDMSLVVETNEPLLKALRMFNAECYKTWRLYEKPLPA